MGEASRRLEGRDHLELAGERIDMERGARISGARFPILRGDLVMLELALVRWRNAARIFPEGSFPFVEARA